MSLVPRVLLNNPSAYNPPLNGSALRLVEKYGLVPRFVLDHPSDASVETDFDVIKFVLENVALDEVRVFPP